MREAKWVHLTYINSLPWVNARAIVKLSQDDALQHLTCTLPCLMMRRYAKTRRA